MSKTFRKRYLNTTNNRNLSFYYHYKTSQEINDSWYIKSRVEKALGDKVDNDFLFKKTTNSIYHSDGFINTDNQWKKHIQKKLNKEIRRNANNSLQKFIKYGNTDECTEVIMNKPRKLQRYL